MTTHWLASEEHAQEWAYEALRALLVPVVRRMLAEIRFEGAEHVPARGPGLLIANHRSSLDPMLIGLGLARHVHFVAEGWLGRLGLGPLLEAAGVILLPREAHRYGALRQAVAHALAAQELVGLFPEGMDRFREPLPAGGVGRFHSSFARLWLDHPDVPLIPIAVISQGLESTVSLPAWIFAALAPRDPRYRQGQVHAVFYRQVLVRYGRPVRLPSSGKRRTVGQLCELGRTQVTTLLEAR